MLFTHNFILDRQKGSHRIYVKNGLRMVLPHHSGKILHPKIVKEVASIWNYRAVEILGSKV